MTKTIFFGAALCLQALVSPPIPVDLTFELELALTDPAAQSLIRSDTYIEAVIADRTRSRIVETTRGIVRSDAKHIWVEGHFAAKGLKMDLSHHKLENLRMILSLRRYEWFGRGQPIASVSIEFNSVLTQWRENSSVAAVEIPGTGLKLDLTF